MSKQKQFYIQLMKEIYYDLFNNQKEAKQICGNPKSSVEYEERKFKYFNLHERSKK